MKQNQASTGRSSAPVKSTMLRLATVTLGMSLLSVFTAPPVYASVTPEPSATTVSQNEVTGTVLDPEGEPLVGVSVRVGNSAVGTRTDINGKYRISAVKGQTLEFSYVGFQKQDVTVDGPVVNITMQNHNELDEVVVVGYGTVRKADLAGSVSVLEGKAFAAQPITQVSEAIQGRVSGVSIVSDGLPGGSTKIRVRGSNSINKSNEPLYVVDGLVRESGLDGINPEDIASMQILKDASSTAIYGSRGANGVVIITTKKGRAGETKLTLDVSVGVSTATHLPKVLGTREYAQALVDYNNTPAANVQQYLDGSDPGVDWKDEVFKTGVVQNYKLVFSKGTENMQLYLSGNYMRHEGIIRETQYERYNGRLNINAKMYPWLDVNADVSLSHGVGKGIGGIELGGYNPLYLAFNYSPTMHMVNDLGEYNKDPYCSINESPMASLTGAQERQSDIVNGHLDLKFTILPGFTFTTSNGLDYYNYYGYGFSSSKRWPGAANSMNNSNTNRWLLQSSNNFTYINTFAEKHNLTATAVWEATKSWTKGMEISGSNLVSESVGWWNVNAATSRNQKNGYSEWALLSGVARVIYNYDNRYMLTGTLRADGSSRLSNNKWSWFPSIAAAWTLSNESFFESVRPVMNNFKLRASYGVIGNQDIAPYSTLAMMTATSTYYGTANPYTGYWAAAPGAPDLKWERTKQVDVGVDLGFFNGRLDVTLDWYYKRTTDALLQTRRPGYLGGQPFWINAGEVSNTGLDFGITANVIQNREWNWTTSVQGSVMKNKVEKMTTGEPRLYSGSMQSIVTDASVIMEGEPIGSLYGFQWAGIDDEGYDTYVAADGSITRTPTSADRVVLGRATPTFTFGWNNTVTWKNWSLNAFFNSAFGAKRINVLRYAMCSMIGNSRMFTSPDAITGMGTTMPDPTVANNQYIGNSSKWVENANYFRLENITLGYDLKKELTRFADIHLSFSIQNLFTITSYKGLNPASYSFGGTNVPEWQQGIDVGTNPCPRTYTFGARFTF